GGYGTTQRLERKRLGKPTPCKTGHGRHGTVTGHRWTSHGLLAGDQLFHRLFFVTHLYCWYRADRHRRGVFGDQSVQRRRRRLALLATAPVQRHNRNNTHRYNYPEANPPQTTQPDNAIGCSSIDSSARVHRERALGGSFDTILC